MTPFREIRRVAGIKAIGTRAELSLWDVDSALAALYDKALEHKLLFSEPAIGIRRGAPGMPDSFHSKYEVLFPLDTVPAAPVPGTEIVELAPADVASFIHRGPYPWIPCTYEQVFEWLRENRCEIVGEIREVFVVAPDPHSGGSQDDMVTEIQVPVGLPAAPGS